MTGIPVTAQRLRTLATSRPALIGLVVFLVYLLAGFFGAPWLLREQLPKLVEQHLGAKATVKDVRVNPLLFRVELQGLEIAERSGLQALQVGRIFVDFETSSLLRWALTFREIRIEKPVINADLDARESLNLARLLAALEQPDRKPDDDEGLPRLLVHKFAIADGAFRFTDHTLQPAAQARVSPINFEIEDVSTLADHRGEHRLNAKLADGGQLQWQGRLSLAPIESSGTITVKDVRLSTAWQFVRDHLTIAEPQGNGHFGVSYRFGYANSALKFEADNLAFGLNDVVIAQEKGGAVLAKLATVAFEGGRFDLAKRRLAFENIRVADGGVSVVLDEDSLPDWAKLVRSRTQKEKGAADTVAETLPGEPPAISAKPWEISLPKVTVGPLTLSLTDYSRAKPLRMTAATTELALAASASFGSGLQAVVEGGALKLGGIKVTPVDEQDAPVTLESAEVTGIAMNLQDKTLRAGLARLSGGRLSALRDAGGELHLVTMFAPRKVQALKELRKEGFRMAVDRAEVTGYSVALSDQSFQPAIGYDLEQIRASVSKLALPPAKTPSPFEMSLRVRQGGSVKASGALDMLRERLEVRFEVADIALPPLDPALKKHTTLSLISGKAGASGRVTLDGKTTPPVIRYNGAAAISDLNIQTEANNEKLVSWKRLSLNDIDVDTAENRVAVTLVELAQPYAKLVINKDRSTNLDAIKRGGTAAAAPATTATAAAPATAPAAPPAAAPAEPPAKAMAVTVERVRVEGGSMDFADFGLVLPFATFIKDLNGSANGLSSSPDSRANLKFEGGVGEYGLARAEGTIQPFAPKKFTDIAVAFRNIELVPMSPYSATFAGRKIASGKISLDLQYKIENSKLLGDNKMVLDQFTLGERVESPTAVNLPLDLAIALLTDSNGKIDLALPVAGDVDNPEFSYGHVIWQAIRTVLTRIVTAPFRALGSLFGGGAETLGDIVFDPGSARVLPTEQEKLRRVAEGLKKRPQLKLQIQGTYHKDIDALALRARAVRADLAAREGGKLAPGEDPGPVGFDNAKTQRALENMLEARAGGDAVAQFAQAHAKSIGRETSRVNAALALVGRGAGDRTLYVAMHQRLVELQPLPATALAELAKARADAIMRAMTTGLQFESARMSTKPADAVEEADKNGVPAKLSFEPLK
jgi:hypothetical protein